MAGVEKLYPPVIKGTITPFYTDNETGTVSMTVPFVMNKIVSLAEVSALTLKIRDADTDADYGRVTSSLWSQTIENPTVVFNLGDPNVSTSIARHLVIGRYYKIQLAYRNYNNIEGYYSTVAIAKFTAQPTLSLVGMDRYSTNNEITEYVGVYNNLSDTTEKAYQYKFTFRDYAGEVLETSGWKTHNVNSDTELGQSTDSYSLMYNILPDEKYTIQYSVLTNNGLECHSPKYQLVGSASIEPELSASLMAILDYDNGCINLRLKQTYLKVIDVETGERERPVLTGSFILSRSSSLENFHVWTKLYTFHLSGQLPEGIIFSDHTVQHGETYRYALQQYNPYGVYSSRMYAEIYTKNEDEEYEPTGTYDIVASFEDMYLFDGERLLTIKFNPKVSSFKTVLQEAKKTTLGAKYPFFFKNGATEYKEFPISGLISYLEDGNESFLSRSEDLGMSKDWQDTTDIIDPNIAYERRFKLAVLDWLNDGKVKLFRSPAEGNYLVRLMNVQLIPNDTLSRMIHTFQCTATEVDDYSSLKLLSYGFLHAEPTIPQLLRFGSINLDEYIEGLVSREGNITNAINYMKSHDLLNGLTCQYLKLEDFRPLTQFMLENKLYYIGATGQYEVRPENGLRGLYIVNPTRHMGGTISYGVLTAMSNSFNTILGVSHHDVFDVPQWSNENYIATHTDIKERINKIYYMRFSLNDLSYSFGTIEEYYNHYGIYFDDENEWQYGDNKKGYTIPLKGLAKGSEAPKFLSEYYYCTPIDSEGTFTYEYTGRNGLDLYIPGTIIHILSTGEVYKYEVDNEPDAQLVGRLTLVSTTDLELGEFQVKIDNDIIDITETREAFLPMTEDIPKEIKWGSAVTAEFCYQVLDINYGVENNTVRDMGVDFPLADMRETVDQSHKYYDASILGLVRKPVTSALLLKIRRMNSNAIDGESYFVWSNGHFHRLLQEEASSFAGSEVWTIFTKWLYNSSQQKCIYNESLNNTMNYDGLSPVSAAVANYPVSASQYQYYRAKYLEGLDAALEIRELELKIGDE